MNDGMLSQEEISALLTNEAVVEDSLATDEMLSDFEKDAIGEIGNISMGTSATTLSTLLGKKVQITTPKVQMTTSQKLSSSYPFPYVVIEVDYTEGIEGINALVVSERDAFVIADLMMGGDGHVDEATLDSIKLSAVSEAMNQMIGSSTTSLSSMFGTKIDITPPRTEVVDLAVETLHLGSETKELVEIRFRMTIEGLIDSEIMQILPVPAVKEMVSLLMGGTTSAPVVSEPQALADESQISAPTVAPPLSEQALPQAAPIMAATPAYGYATRPHEARVGEVMQVQPVQFMDLEMGGNLNLAQSINLIMDVPLEVTVQLGRATKTIKEILDLTEGSIIQLDKLAGEPVELLVNGKLIAKGEVVVIDENYGIRVTSILSPMDRMDKLQ